MNKFWLTIVAGLSMMAPGAALAQEDASCELQTITQLLGLEDVPGCTTGDSNVGENEADGEAPVGEERLTGLQNAHEASGGRSTEALEHANAMSGGAVMSALSRSGGDDDDDDSDQDDDSGEDDDDGNDGGGRPDHAGGGRR